MAEPPLTIRAAHSGGTTNHPIDRIVIHTTSPNMPGTTSSAAGMARATARYFTSSASGGSAHYVVDIGPTEEHCLYDNEVAWHAPPNRFSIGIEICGIPSYTRAQWLSPSVWPAVANAARRTKELCARFGVPTVRRSAQDLRAGKRGICGHVDVSQAWKQSDHWDPGPNFPWDRFIAAVIGTQPAPTPPPAQPVWDYPEDHVKTTLVLIGPLDDQGRGYGDWYIEGVPNPVIVGAVKQGPDPSPGSVDSKGGDPYWEKQGPYEVSASPRGQAVRVVITKGVPGQTVGVYVSAA